VRVHVRYFADAREAARQDAEELDLGEGASVREAIATLLERHPALREIASRSRVAVDERFAGPDERLRAGATLALIPPVGGG
jgi:molybdopterin synthase catalytic subunit